MSDNPRNARPRYGGREYVWPSKPPYELVVPSSTTIAGMLPKPAIAAWSTKVTAEYAVDKRTAWDGLPRQDAIDLIKRAPRRYMEQRGEVGSAVHSAIAVVSDGGTIPDLSEEEKGFFDGAVAFLQDYDVTVLRSESTVYSRRHQYAGTFDLLARIDGLTFLVDYKTSKAVYDDHAVQLASYAFAEFIGEKDDTETQMEGVHGGLIVRLTTDGDYEVVPFDLTPAVFDVFLSARRIFDWKKLAPEVRGEPWAKSAA